MKTQVPCIDENALKSCSHQFNVRKITGRNVNVKKVSYGLSNSKGILSKRNGDMRVTRLISRKQFALVAQINEFIRAN